MKAWFLTLVLTGSGFAQNSISASISTSAFTGEVNAFLAREMAAHIADIKTVNPPQAKVLDAQTTGEFSWGTFIRAAAVVSQLLGNDSIAGRDLPKFLGQAGLIEARGGGKAFAQMYAALALRRYGTDLKSNPLWQSLTASEQQEWRSLLDPARFYDRATRHVIDLPENYFGVASRVITMDYQMGIVTDRVYVDDLLNQAARQFVEGEIYSDDALPTGRFDRYSQEYARYVYEAAENIGRKDVMTALEPSIKTQLRLWWDLLAADGYGYPWGRSLGVIGYMDTMEIVGFVAEHPQFRPAPLPQMAAAYRGAWQSLMREYIPERHLLNVFGFGHGHYSYINPEREWQQTTGFFGKIANAQILFQQATSGEHLTSFPAKLDLPPVARFEYFRHGNRPAGVWIVRQGALQFALPITTGTKPGIADYLPAPHGLTGFAAPVEQQVPALTPYLELMDGTVLVASDGADEIRPGADGRSLTAVWKRWVTVTGKPAQFVEPGLTSEVRWSIDGATLVRSETITASRPITIRQMHVLFPSTSDHVATRLVEGRRIDRFASIEVEATGPLITSVRATGASALNRGNQEPILLLLDWEADQVAIKPGTPFHWTFTARPLAK
jgi:hypothetical protein